MGLRRPPGIARNFKMRKSPEFAAPAGINRLHFGQRRSQISILAEVEFLSRVFGQRIADELLVTIWAEIEAEMFADWRKGIRIVWLAGHLLQQFADGLHVIVVEIRFGQLARIVGGERLDFDDVAIVL